MVPQFQTAEFLLLFKDSISVYKSAPKDDAPDPFENNNGNHFVMRFTGPGDGSIVYRNSSNSRLLEETTLAEKKYVVTDTILQLSWKLSTDTMTVLGHLCKKATTTSPRGASIVAWYTSDIPLPIGPDQFSGLPGAILKIDSDNGGLLFTAKSIQQNIEAKQLKEPADGKLITRADFRKKMDEVLGPADAQGRRIIRN